MQPERNVQHTGKPGETEERPGQEANYSPQNLHAHDEEGAGSTSLMCQRTQGTSLRWKALEISDDLDRTPAQEWPGRRE